MSFLDSLKRLFTAPSSQIEHYEYVRCDRCGENISARINLRNDLSREYDERTEKDFYYCRKVVVGSGMCFQKIEIELFFNANRVLRDRAIKGGSFITREEFDSSDS